MTKDTEVQAIADDVYDYLFENTHNIGTNFLESFEESYIDGNVIYLDGSYDLGKYKITIERI